MRSLIILSTTLLLMSVSLVCASEQRGKLVLYKEPLFSGGNRSGACEGLFDVRSGNNVPDMRDFQYYACEGRYTLTLNGKAGSMITLYGKFNFEKDWGFLIIVKKDDSRIWLLDLEGFPANQWVEGLGVGKKGAYEAYYHKSSQFKRNISSVKWGKWWQGETPNP